VTSAQLREILQATLAEAFDAVMLGETIDHGMLSLIATLDGALAALDRLDERTSHRDR